MDNGVRSFHCSSNSGRLCKQLNSIVSSINANLGTSQKHINDASEEIFKLLAVLPRAIKLIIEEENLSISPNQGSLTEENYCEQLERRSSSCSKISCCGCLIEEQESDNKPKTTKENTARTHSSDVRAAKATVLRKPGLGILVYLKGENKNSISSGKSSTSVVDSRKDTSVEAEKLGLLTQDNLARKEDTDYSRAVSSSEFDKVQKLTTEEINCSLTNDYRAFSFEQNQLQTDCTKDLQSHLDKFSSVVQSVMKGIESCSQLANSLSSIPTDPPTERSLSLVAENGSMGSISDLDDHKLPKTTLDIGKNSADDSVPPPAKVFDFASEEDNSGEVFTIKPREEHRQSIDIEAEFQRVFATKEQENLQQNDPTRIVSFEEGNEEYENAGKKPSKNSKESKKKANITRSKSENSVKGVKRFKLSRIFNRKSKSLKKDKKEEVIPSDIPAWDDYGLAGSTKREGSFTNRSIDTLKSIGSKDSFLIESETERNMNGWSSTEALDNEIEQAPQSTERVEKDEKDKIIKQLEDDKAALNVEKMDLMSALSNIWIEMEDLKNQSEEEKSGRRNSFSGGLPLNTKSSGNELKLRNNNNGASSDLSKQEQNNLQNMSTQINELNNINEGLRYEQDMQNQTIKSLQNKLTSLTENQEASSRTINGLLEENKALKEGTQSSINNKEVPKVAKLKEENFSLKTRLDNLQNARLLAEKNQQKVQIENKRLKTLQIKMDERCAALLQKIEKELQTGEDASPAGIKIIENENVLNLPSEGQRRMSDNISPEFESLSDSDSYHSESSVKQMVKSIERSRSTDSELNVLGQREEGRELWANGIRRSVTMGSLSSNKSLSGEDREILETKVSRFPPTQLSSSEKARKEAAKNDNGRRSTKKKNPEEMTAFSDLEISCSKLLEKYKELKTKESKNEKELKTAKEKHPSSESNARKQSESVLYLCLRNLQKENDALKLDNLNLKTKMDDVHNMDHLVTSQQTNRKPLVKQNAEKDWKLEETHVEPAEQDFGIFDSFIDERLSKADGLAEDAEGRTFFDEIDGIRREGHEQEGEIDVSSWHRKHSEKKSREKAKAFRKKELDLLKIDNDFAEVFSAESESPVSNHESSTEPNLARARALSLDGGLIAVEQSLRNNELEECGDSMKKESSINSQMDAVDEKISALQCNDQRSPNGEDHSSGLPRLKETEQEKNSPVKRSYSENKAVRKALSTCRSRERLFTVYYV